MNMNAIASTLQFHINVAFMNFLKRKYPDREFSKEGFSDVLTVDEGQDISDEEIAASLTPQTVAGHYRENVKTGEVKWIEEYTKQPKSLTAMDIAVSEVNAENGGNTGLDMEAELEAFIDALLTGTITLGQMNSKD